MEQQEEMLKLKQQLQNQQDTIAQQQAQLLRLQLVTSAI